MNTKSTFDDEHVRREWEAQELAIREGRRRTAASDDVRVAQYRFVARALRQPPLDPLPTDFAYRTAAWVEKLADAANDKLEARLQRGLFVLMAIGSIGTMVFYADAWLAIFATPLPRLADVGLTALESWGVPIAVCFGLAWAIEQWFRRIQGRGGTPPS